MKLSDTSRLAQRFLKYNAPALLTSVGVVGTVGTAYLAGKASFKAAEIISKQQTKLRLNGEDDTIPTKERVALLWKLYIPAVASAAGTIGAIVFANRISAKRLATMAAAYSISERTYSEYKDKVKEHLTGPKEQKIRDEIAQDRVTANPPTDKNILAASKGDVLCHEAFTGRYFWSDMESIRGAQNTINTQIRKHDFATLSDFYDLLSLPHTSVSDEFGWNNAMADEVELGFSSVLKDERTPVLSFDYLVPPFPEPGRFC